MKENTNNTEALLKNVIRSLDDKLAKDIRIIDISDISIVADYIVIASGQNPNQIHAMIDNVLENVHKAGNTPRSIEGYDKANWVLIDLNDIIIHVFDNESRSFYNLERLFADGKQIDLTPFIP